MFRSFSKSSVTVVKCYFIRTRRSLAPRSPWRCSSSLAADADSATEDSIPTFTRRRRNIWNLAVIAHVDHGKTSLVDQLLRAAADTMSDGAKTDGISPPQPERLLDTGDLEKERGITITSKVTRLEYRQSESTAIINLVDTPGHADFCGEVDRILSMVDGVLLVVDISEGPKSQTKYVLQKALAQSLTPIVVFNKCDKEPAALDSGVAERDVEQLLVALRKGDTKDHDVVTVYASAKQGWATLDPLEALELAEQKDGDFGGHGMHTLLQAIVQTIPEPCVTTYSSDLAEGDDALDGPAFASDPFSLAAVSVGYDPYLGRTCIGRITSGSLSMNDSVTLLKREQESSPDNKSFFIPSSTVSGMFVYHGISRTPFPSSSAYAGDILQIAGVPEAMAVGDTLTSTNNPVPHALETLPLAPPTLAMDFGANTGPLAGTEGSRIASAQIRQRLIQETDNNVTLVVKPCETDVEKTTVYARGELQLGILIETMRREGFELLIAPPRILTKPCPVHGSNRMLEPFEEVTVDVDVEYASTVVSRLTSDRKGVLVSSQVMADGKARLVLEVPTRGLLGFHSEIATATKGNAVVNHLFLEDREYVGSLGVGLEKGKLVSNASGKATSFALDNLQQRGTLFIEPQELVYPGMVIGENAKVGDLEVNPVKAKEVSNMR